MRAARMRHLSLTHALIAESRNFWPVNHCVWILQHFNFRTSQIFAQNSTIFGRPFAKRFALCYLTVAFPVCRVCSVCPVLSVCDVGVLWPNCWTEQDLTWYGYRPRPRQHCIRWGPSSSQRGTAPPLFGPCLLWPNGSPSQQLLSSCLEQHTLYGTAR